MAKIIWVYSKKGLQNDIENKFHKICEELSPDNIIPTEPKIKKNGNHAFAIMNPTNTIIIKKNSVLIGNIMGDSTNWYVPMQNFPDGSYALFRDGSEYCEIVSDPVSSRTIWYYMNEEIFIASTSQRAIILYIGGFEFNKSIIPWMLSNGTLGPLLSWDKRINCIPPDSSVILNKNNWTLTTKIIPIEFKEIKDTDNNHEKKLRETLLLSFKNLNLNYSKWILPLSGGYDSRGILCFLTKTTKNTKDLKAITWGLKSSLTRKTNDAYIAIELAKEFNLTHKYFHTDLSDEPIEIIIDRFFLNGEGRIDQISGYIDGFKIWKTLFEEGIHGIIRGDEGFGCKSYSTVSTARINQACALCSDFSNLKDYQKYGIPKQELPQYLKQMNGESLSTYRDRLFHQHAFSTHFSALSDLKLSYIEVIKPLLTRTILQQVRTLPDHLRTNKSLFKKIVISLSHKIDFATQGANANRSDILRQIQLVDLIKQELTSPEAETIISAEFIKYILKNIITTNPNTIGEVNSKSLKISTKRLFSLLLEKTLWKRRLKNTEIDFNIIAFRIFIILKMNKLLSKNLI